MGHHRETVGVLPQHPTPPAIFAAICRPDVVTGRFPTTLAGVHPVGFQVILIPHSSSVVRHHTDVANIDCCDWTAHGTPVKAAHAATAKAK